jgi:hypothetical protein
MTQNKIYKRMSLRNNNMKVDHYSYFISHVHNQKGLKMIALSLMRLSKLKSHKIVASSQLNINITPVMSLIEIKMKGVIQIKQVKVREEITSTKNPNL